MRIFVLLMIVGTMFASLATGAGNNSKPIVIDSRITEVTVYPTGATIVRSGSIDLKAGTYEIIFKNLPPTISEDSLRASGSGPGVARILGLSVERTFSEKATREEVRVLEEKIIAMRDEKQVLEDKLSSLALGEDFLRRIKAVAPEKISRDIVMREMKVEEYSKMLKFMVGGIEDINKQKREAGIALRELGEKMRVVERDFYKIRNMGGKEHKKVSVGFEVAEAGKYEVNISYRLYNASWHPVYDVRANNDQSELELTYYGVVQQSTGEDWEDVRVVLSTARPSAGARMPELQPWLLSFSRVFGGKDKERKPASSGFGYANKSLARNEMDQKSNLFVVQSKVAQHVSARAESRGTSVAFAVARREKIKADGRPHKTTISVEQFKPEIEYFTTPKASNNAYLSAKITNNTDKPLLSGKMNVFVGGDYVGAAKMDFVAQNEEFRIFLGIDDGIKVKREMDNTKSIATETNKRKKLDFAFDIEIHNLKKKSVKITVVDQLPVSQDSDIKVRVGKLDPKPSEQDTKGMVKWELNLIGGEKTKIRMEFSIDYPKEKRLGGDLQVMEEQLYENFNKQEMRNRKK